MSVSTKLSKLKKVPLRDVWQNEAADFTKWLAREENLSMLGDAIGIDLEPIETESSVGSFSADIYAKTADDRKVIVENQLEDSDHDHLGKIITYASGKDARVIVWIVARARPEHAQAVEWLNAHTDEDIGLFLIEMELWKIGGSDPAPKFSVVERPNDWGKAMKGYEVLSPTKQAQLDYWQAFHDQASSDEAFMRVLRPQMPHPQNWSDLAIGSSLCHINLTADTQKGRISCGASTLTRIGSSTRRSRHGRTTSPRPSVLNPSFGLDLRRVVCASSKRGATSRGILSFGASTSVGR